MPRVPLALALASALAACGGSDAQTCPGTAVATFLFTGTRVSKGDAALAGLDPDSDAPDCPAELAYPEGIAFSGTLAADPGSGAAALCKERGVVLFGQRSGARFVVELGTAGAVLGGCAASCSALMRLTVAGDVAGSPEGGPTEFEGALVETLSAADGADCGACTPALPCEARYALTGAP